MLLLSGYVFLDPYIIGYIPAGGELGLGLMVALSAMAALVVPMNVYRIRMLSSAKRKMGGGVIGSVIGAATGACGCGFIGFSLISAFGATGAAVSAFVTNYEIPLRIGAVALLAITYYATSRSLSVECRVRG